MTKSFESNSNNNESIADNSLVSSFSTSLSISVSVSASASKSISTSVSSASAASTKSSEASKYSELSAWRSSTAKEASDDLAKSSSSSSSSDDDFLGGLNNADFLVGLGDLSKDMPSNSSESSSEASAAKLYDASVKASKASLSAHIKAVGAEDSYSDNRYYDVHDDKWGTADLFLNNDGSVDVDYGKISNRPLYNALPKGKANKVKSVTFHSVIAPINCFQLLSNLPNVNKIDLSDLDMSNTNNICNLFSEDGSLHEVNLTSLNTNRINDMYGMFYGDDQIKLLKLGKDTILDDTIAGHINDDYWYETSTGYEGFLHSFNIKEPQIFVNDGVPDKINPKNLTSSLIGNYFLKYDKSLANFANRFKSPFIHGDIINSVLWTKLQDTKNKLKVYDKCFIDFYITYRFNKEFKEWCYEYYSEPQNAKGYSKWRTTNDYSRCFDNVFTNLSKNAKAIMTPEKILHMINKDEYTLSSNYNHTTRDEEKLLKYLIKHNINPKDALIDVKDEPKFQYVTTHNDDKANSLRIKLENKISLRNELQFLHKYFDSNTQVHQLLDDVDTPDDLTKRQFLRKIRYSHDLIKKYNVFYNEHRFIGESRVSSNTNSKYEEMTKSFKQGVYPKSLMKSKELCKFTNYIYDRLTSSLADKYEKNELINKMKDAIRIGNPIKVMKIDCNVLSYLE